MMAKSGWSWLINHVWWWLIIVTDWLVVEPTPLEKWWLICHLGWNMTWNSQLNGNMKHYIRHETLYQVPKHQADGFFTHFDLMRRCSWTNQWDESKHRKGKPWRKIRLLRKEYVGKSIEKKKKEKQGPEHMGVFLKTRVIHTQLATLMQNMTINHCIFRYLWVPSIFSGDPHWPTQTPSHLVLHKLQVWPEFQQGKLSYFTDLNSFGHSSSLSRPMPCPAG